MNETTSLNPPGGCRNDLPRERLLKNGAGHLSAAELLAVCLGSGCQGVDVVTFSRKLLGHFGGLDALLQAPAHELLGIRGLGPAKVSLIKALAELTLRDCEAGIEGSSAGCGSANELSMQDAGVVARYLQRRLGHAQNETFACMYLDTRHRLLAYEAPFLGSVNRAYVFPRTLLKRSMELNAAAVIFAHNHPSGIAEPSQADITLTHDLCLLFSKLDIQVLDHFVIAARQTVSMASRGLLPSPAQAGRSLRDGPQVGTGGIEAG